jgi:hypothetical protein
MASALIIVANPWPQRPSCNHILHKERIDARGADLQGAAASVLEQLCCPSTNSWKRSRIGSGGSYRAPIVLLRLLQSWRNTASTAIGLYPDSRQLILDGASAIA